MTGPFINPLARQAPGVVNSARTIKQWTRTILGLDDATIVSVNELVCSLPDCPPKETVILVMRPEKQTLQASIHKPMRAITFEDVSVAWVAKSEDSFRAETP
ncbi:hypothetical protein ILFOPFJJ_05527 [Ensifer psoraleae]|uniref:hypothetical protein n=1 Tax=Sinorhizobium psoraleae TaxID=520838 RepID=UPI0015683E87|nr:hypothetical protein [Sinorhizobium psoraleae]NRP74605.1 hypothetical protein [Sinorhizobium psoraleae]